MCLLKPITLFRFCIISFPQQTEKLEFARRAGGQVVHFIYVIENSLTRSVSFHWPYAGQSEQPAAFSITCYCEKQITTSWQSLSIYESRSSTSVGALIERPQGKVLYSYFFRRKGTIQRKFILEFGTFSRAVNDRPYKMVRYRAGGAARSESKS